MLERLDLVTDGSLLDGRAGGTAVRVEHGVERERVLLPLGEGQVAEGEVEGLICATERTLNAGDRRILIVLDL